MKIEIFTLEASCPSMGQIKKHHVEFCPQKGEPGQRLEEFARQFMLLACLCIMIERIGQRDGRAVCRADQRCAVYLLKARKVGIIVGRLSRLRVLAEFTNQPADTSHIGLPRDHSNAHAARYAQL